MIPVFCMRKMNFEKQSWLSVTCDQSTAGACRPFCVVCGAAATRRSRWVRAASTAAVTAAPQLFSRCKAFFGTWLDFEHYGGTRRCSSALDSPLHALQFTRRGFLRLVSNGASGRGDIAYAAYCPLSVHQSSIPPRLRCSKNGMSSQVSKSDAMRCVSPCSYLFGTHASACYVASNGAQIPSFR